MFRSINITLVETSNSYLRLRGLSLQQRLPLLICILLLSLMVLFSWISFQGVKNAAMDSGKERLLSLTTQFSTMFSQSMQLLFNSTRTQANHPNIKKFISNPAMPGDSASHVLERIRQDSTSISVDLLDKDYQLLLRSSKDSIHRHVNFDSLLQVISIRRDTAIGKIFSIRDSIYYPVIAPVMNNKAIIGYLVRWRLLSTNPRSIEQLSQLIGTNAAIYIGNEDGSLWTNMVKAIPYYPIDSNRINTPVEHKTETGKKIVTAMNRIPGTQWVVSVEFSQENILQSANRFLRWMIIGGMILLAIGILLAWIMSRNIIRPLNRLTEATSGIASGAHIQIEGTERRDEVGKLARAFNIMNEQVREARLRLEQKIVETGEMNVQLRNLTAHLQDIREEERIHIAREMHDELGQLLTAFKMDISWLKKRFRDNPDVNIVQKLDDMSKLTDDAVVFVRKIASELRPSVLDDFGLVPALEWHSEEFQKRFNIEVDFTSGFKEVKTSAIIATGLFRMYQESLTNVARHADASKVTAQLRVINDKLTLSITDNGKGFDISKSDQHKTLGLLGMKERAAMMGGTLDVKSEPGRGTAVIISVPFQQPYNTSNEITR